MKKSLIFFGNERLATGVTTEAPGFSGLIENGYDIKALVINNTEAHGRRKRPLEIAEVAKKHNIPIIYPAEATPDRLMKLGAEAGILAAYGKLVSKETIDVFPSGIINIHPSLLPKYRGSSPIERTILDGVKQTGVSLMALVPEMDAGPIYAQEEISLKGVETKQELADHLDELGSRILLANLGQIITGSLIALPQNEKEATYTSRVLKENGVLNLSKAAEALDREVRAYAGWPRSRLQVFGAEIIVTRSRVIENRASGSLVVQCSPGFLEILELIAPSGRKMSGADFIRGYRNS